MRNTTTRFCRPLSPLACLGCRCALSARPSQAVSAHDRASWRGCLSARFWIGAGEIARREHRWILDAPVSCMTLAVAAGLVISLHPEPLSALLYGGGVGILGEGVFKLAEQRINKLKAILGLGDKPAV